MNTNDLQQIAYQAIIDLATEEGINASGKDEVYGCIFGRDSFLTILKLLNYHIKTRDERLLEICRRSLLNLIKTQGTQIHIDCGEEPGKFIHELRKDKYEHLTSLSTPWYVHPDGWLRNYDSIDSTPLGLIAIYKYYLITHDDEFLKAVIPSVEMALNWILEFGDRDGDYLIEYDFPESRKYGGLAVQSWTDSQESLHDIESKFPKYPIAPVEVQSYVWLALKYWGDFFKNSGNKKYTNSILADKLHMFANNLKLTFNQTFLFEDHGFMYTAQALDGNKNQIKTITGNSLILLWSSFASGESSEAIIDKHVMDQIVQRGFKEDLFDHEAGIRTMSMFAPTYNPNADSYHNGSFWPILNGLIHEGLVKWGYYEQAEKLKQAALKPLAHFKSPIELYMKDQAGNYFLYQSASGQQSCRQQAWSAAATLDLISI